MIRIDCLMPTLPGRQDMRRRAAASFSDQDLPTGWSASLSLDSDPKLSLGQKLNEMIVRSSADYFVLLDDDDWHHPLRVFSQVKPLVNEEAEITGTSKIYYFDYNQRVAWLYTGDGSWIGGMAFHRSVWERCKFDDLSQGVDYRWQTRTKARILDIGQPWLFVAGIHPGNTCRKMTSVPQWHPVSFDDLPPGFVGAIGRLEVVSA